MIHVVSAVKQIHYIKCKLTTINQKKKKELKVNVKK